MSTDSAIMLRRNFKHTLRNPTTVFNALLLPIVILLMFVCVIGGAVNVGVDYIDYATPGMIVLAICPPAIGPPHEVCIVVLSAAYSTASRQCRLVSGATLVLM